LWYGINVPGDDQDVEFGEAGIGFLELDVSTEASTLGSGGELLGGDEGGREGFGG
jgi:hypothetical protein